jgi:hypothetical protein
MLLLLATTLAGVVKIAYEVSDDVNQEYAWFKQRAKRITDVDVELITAQIVGAGEKAQTLLQQGEDYQLASSLAERSNEIGKINRAVFAAMTATDVAVGDDEPIHAKTGAYSVAYPMPKRSGPGDGAGQLAEPTLTVLQRVVEGVFHASKFAHDLDESQLLLQLSQEVAALRNVTQKLERGGISLALN